MSLVAADGVGKSAGRMKADKTAIPGRAWRWFYRTQTGGLTRGKVEELRDGFDVVR
jgi:hypothetical protein